MYALDIETAPLDNAADLFNPDDVKTGNTKDPDKIKIKIDAAKMEFTNKAALSWMTGRITCICLYSPDKLHAACGGDEDDLLRMFWDQVDEHVITWKGYRFDVPYIYMRSCVCGVKPTFNIHIERYGRSKNRDIMQELSGWGANKWMGLNKAAQFFLGEEKTGDGKGAIELWKEGNIEELTKYCMKDAELTWEIAEKVKDYL